MASARLPSTVALAVLHRGALDACDAGDGREVGIVGTAASCGFDPAVMRCRPGSARGPCRSAAQVAFTRPVFPCPAGTRDRGRGDRDAAASDVPVVPAAWR